MRVRYIGMFEAVEFDDVVHGRLVARRVERGDAIDVDASIGVRLLEQAANWEAAEPPSSGGAESRRRGAAAPEE